MDFFSSFLVLNPAGSIGLAERGLIIHAVLLMLIVVVPVYVLLFFFAWRYRASNKKAAYTPNWEHAKVDELIWWAIPFEIILVLGALTWSSTHELDPRKPLPTPVAPMTIEVVALNWKWLFVYPEEGVATVGTLVMPTERPVRFNITADAPMNSFWIPQLGGQVYAMTGMVNSLHLMANVPGVYKGGSANYSGDGFAHMNFEVRALPQDSFDEWVMSLRASSLALDPVAYETLREPSTGDVIEYGLVDPTLFASIVERFSMHPGYYYRGEH